MSDPAGEPVVVGTDGLARCPWAVSDPLSLAYHDTEWGVAVHGERALYERITLEAFQAGLSWRTILAKRPAFRAAFDDFDPEVVARYGETEIERLMGDAAIVRNRLKIEATCTNAQAVLELRRHGGLDALIWSHRPTRTLTPITAADVPTRSAASQALATDLRAHGIRFVGPTMAQALMKAVGMVDGHLVGCHRRGCSGANVAAPS